MAQLPEQEHIHFLLRWWQEILGGAAVIVLGWYARLRGKNPAQIIPLSEKHIDNKLKICEQNILLRMQEALDAQEEKIISRVKDLLPAKHD